MLPDEAHAVKPTLIPGHRSSILAVAVRNIVLPHQRSL